MIAMTTCIRCGKMRILGKTWREKVGISTITYTLTVCPDNICQKKVETLLKERQEESESRIRLSLERREVNRRMSLEARRIKNRVHLKLN